MIEKILGRVVRMIKFDYTVYKEIEDDQGANVEAFVVVLVSSVLAAIGGAAMSSSPIGGFFGHLISSLLGWLIFSWVTMFVGTRLFKGETNFWEMARCLGYANAVWALGILAVIPCVGLLVLLAVLVLYLVIAFFAAREALDLPTERTLLTLVIGWVIYFLLQIVWQVIF